MKTEDRTTILQIKSGRIFDLNFTAPGDSTVIEVNTLKLELVRYGWSEFPAGNYNFQLKTKSRFYTPEHAKATKTALQKWMSEQQSAITSETTASSFKKDLNFTLFSIPHVFHGVWVKSYLFNEDETRLKVSYGMDVAGLSGS